MQRAVWICLGLLAYGLYTTHPVQTVNAAYLWQTLNVGIEVESSGDLVITETQSYDVPTDKHRGCNARSPWPMSMASRMSKCLKTSRLWP